MLHVRFPLGSAKYDDAGEAASGNYVKYEANGAPLGNEITSVSKRAAEQAVLEPAAE